MPSKSHSNHWTSRRVPRKDPVDCMGAWVSLFSHSIGVALSVDARGISNFVAVAGQL